MTLVAINTATPSQFPAIAGVSEYYRLDEAKEPAAFRAALEGLASAMGRPVEAVQRELCAGVIEHGDWMYSIVDLTKPWTFDEIMRRDG